MKHGEFPRAVALLIACSCAMGASSPQQAAEVQLTSDPNFTAVQPVAQDGSGNDQGVYLPPIAGPNSQITGTVLPDEGSGTSGFYVGARDSNGVTRYWKGTTDQSGRFRLRLPPLSGGLASLILFKHFDTRGEPDRGATLTVTDKPVQLADMQPVIGYIPSGPAIVAGNTSYQRGGNAYGVMQLLTRGLDAANSHVLLDGSTADVDTLAASDSSIVGRLRDTAALGKRVVSVQSGTRRTNGFKTYIIALTFSQLTPLQPGDVEQLSMQVEGLGKDPAVARFDVIGAASLADGSPSTTVPIVDGRSEVTLRGQRPGQLQISVTIDVQMPLVAL